MGGVILREPGDKKIMMADDCALYRAELRGVINKQGRLRVGAEAECGGQTIKVVSKVPADAILFALRLPRHTGYEVLRRIREISDIRKKADQSRFGGSRRRGLGAQYIGGCSVTAEAIGRVLLVKTKHL